MKNNGVYPKRQVELIQGVDFVNDLLKWAGNMASMKLVDDFRVLLTYASKNKVGLSEKEDSFPIRHIRKLMSQFKVKEADYIQIGEKKYPKRREYEYRRFSFLLNLAISADFIFVEENGLLKPGSNFDVFFSSHALVRPAMLFWHFYLYFDFDIWFPSGNFGSLVNEKRLELWPYLSSWQKGLKVVWKQWTDEVTKALSLHWEAADQRFSKDHIRWGLEACLIEPMDKFFGILDLRKKANRDGERLDRLWMRSSMGQGFFSEVDRAVKDIHSQGLRLAKMGNELVLVDRNQESQGSTLH